MKSFLHSRDAASKGAALMIVLAFVVLLTGLVLAYFSRTSTDRQLAQSSYNDTSADLLARSALDIIVSDFKQEVLNNPTVSASNIQPTPYGTPSPGQTPIPNLIRRSFSGDPTGRTSNVPSSSPSSNGRSITTARWNSHYLVPPASTSATPASSPVSSFVAPDWVLVTAQGPVPTPSPSAVIGRYAFAVYDEGGLLDMNLAGYGNYPAGGGGGGSPPTPTPWAVNVGRKGVLGLADLTALPGSPTVITPTTSFGSMSSFLTNAPINSIVGWRNFANTGQADNTYPSGFSFPANLNKQDIYGSFLLDFGDPPYSSPSPFPTYPFTSVDTATSNSRTDQAFMTRQELLKLQSSLGFSQTLLQYMGTFSRERNQPARNWNRLNGHLPDRFDITNLGLVKPNPSGTPSPPPGKGTPKHTGRGRIRGDAISILDLFGLQWVNGINTIPGSSPPQPMPTSDPRYWPHWQYVGRPGFTCNPNGNGCDHIPALRGGRNDFFQLLDYAIKGQANGTNDDTVNIATILGLGASLIDQYDVSTGGATADDAVFPSVSTSPSPWPWPGSTPLPTHTTIIQCDRSGAATYVLGWERQDRETNDPHGPLGKLTPAPGATPIVIDHAFTTTAELGYGLKTEESFTPLDLHTSGSLESALLDFFTYNPVDHSFPRLGIVNLNTKNPPVLAAILNKALKRDVDAAPTPNPLPTVPPSEAMSAAQAIVTETWTNNRPALNRQDIARLTNVAASQISSSFSVSQEETDKCKETIARALSELGQARTWNLLIDVIAQTGKYKPNSPDLTGGNFVVEGEKRYWLHIALGRDLVSGSVDVLGTQLEEVVE
jgi:hypothetical protein